MTLIVNTSHWLTKTPQGVRHLPISYTEALSFIKHREATLGKEDASVLGKIPEPESPLCKV